MEMTAVSAQAVKNKNQSVFDKEKMSSAAQAGASFNEVLGRSGAALNPNMNVAATETAMLQSFNRMVESSRQKMSDKSQSMGGKDMDRDDGPAARPAKVDGKKSVQREERAVRKSEDKPVAEKPEAYEDTTVSAKSDEGEKVERTGEKAERKSDADNGDATNQAAEAQAPVEHKAENGMVMARVQDVTVMVVEETTVEVTVSVKTNPEEEFRALANRMDAMRNGKDAKDTDLKIEIDVEVESSSEMFIMSGEGEVVDADVLKAKNALAKPTLSAQAAALSNIFEQGAQVQVSVTDNSKSSGPSNQHGHGVSAAALAVSAMVNETENLSGENLEQGLMQNPNAQAQTGDAEKLAKNGQANAATNSGKSDNAPSLASFVHAVQAQMEAEGEKGGIGRQISSVASASNSANANQASPIGPAGQASGTQNANNAQATQAAQAPKLPIPPQKIAEQISVQIEKAAKDGLDKISIQLNPEELGRVDIKLEIGRDGKVSASIVVDRPDTLEAIQKEAKSLEKALESAGLKSDAGSLNFSLRGNENQQRQAEREGRGKSQQDEFADNLSLGTNDDDVEIVNLLASRSRAAAARSGVDVNI
jgi:flagellar hook-length control protein FliK